MAAIEKVINAIKTSLYLAEHPAHAAFDGKSRKNDRLNWTNSVQLTAFNLYAMRTD